MGIAEIKEKIVPVLKKYGIRQASVFGSVARGESQPDSDVDLVVKLGSLRFGIWGFVGLKQDLEQALGRKVDVISQEAVSPRLAVKIKKDLKQIYAQRA